MRTLLLVAAAAFAVSCKKAPAPQQPAQAPAPDNAATQAAESLRQDVDKAKAAAEKANAAITATNEEIGKAQAE